MNGILSHFSTIIVGGGCLGASAFYSLKKRGIKNILLLEKNTVGSGITAHSGGMVRTFHNSPLDREMSSYSLQHFYRLHRDIGLPIKQCGSLSITTRAALSKLDHSHYPILDYKSLKKRFQHLNFTHDEVGIYEPKGASINPSNYSKLIIQNTKESGDQILENTEVIKVMTPKFNTIHVIKTSQGNFSTSNLILAIGSSIPTLIPDPFSSQLFSRRLIHIFDLPTKFCSKLTIPNFFDYKNIFYGTINFAGSVGNLKVGVSSKSSQPKEQIIQLAKNRFKFDVTEIHYSHQSWDVYLKGIPGMSCQIAGRKNLYVMSGYGGGAFKFSPYLGESIANLVERTKNGHNIIL